MDGYENKYLLYFEMEKLHFFFVFSFKQFCQVVTGVGVKIFTIKQIKFNLFKKEFFSRKQKLFSFSLFVLCIFYFYLIKFMENLIFQLM
jgi:hypothetical protein